MASRVLAEKPKPLPPDPARHQHSAIAPLGPAIAEISILVDVRLIDVDQQVLVALGAGQNILELLDERLSPLRVGPAQQLLGFLPGQLASRTTCFQDNLRRCRAARIVSRQHPSPNRSRTPPTRRRNVQRGAGSAPTTGGVAAVRWAVRIASLSSASRRGQKGAD